MAPAPTTGIASVLAAAPRLPALPTKQTAPPALPILIPAPMIFVRPEHALIRQFLAFTKSVQAQLAFPA